MSQTTQRSDIAGTTAVPERDRPDHAAPAAALGLIGLGPAGLAAALTLAAAGYRPLACDPDPERLRAYADAAGPDADLTDSPAEVGARCTVILLMLALGDDAATVHGALHDTLRPGSLLVDMGPALPGDIRRLAAELAATGIRLIDAPLLPGPEPVVLAGGTEADLALARPYLAPLGAWIPTGPVGSAQALSALLAELDAMPDADGIRALAARG